MKLKYLVTRLFQIVSSLHNNNKRKKLSTIEGFEPFLVKINSKFNYFYGFFVWIFKQKKFKSTFLSLFFNAELRSFSNLIIHEQLKTCFYCTKQLNQNL